MSGQSHGLLVQFSSVQSSIIISHCQPLQPQPHPHSAAGVCRRHALIVHHSSTWLRRTDIV